MPKNNKGGKKFKRGKKRGPDDFTSSTTRMAEEGQIYAQIKKKLGGSRLEVDCSDSKVRHAIIPGKFRKRVWMNPGDIVLASIEETSDDNLCYIEQKYNPHDISFLRNKGLINFEETQDAYEFKADTDLFEIEPQRVYGTLPTEDGEIDGEIDIDAI